MERETDVVVVGAGIPSLALASKLQGHGVRTLLLDARRGPDSFTRGLTLQPNGLQAVEQLGLLDEVLKLGKPVQIFEIRDWNRELLLEANYGLLDCAHNFLITIDGTRLEQMLRDSIDKASVEIMWGTRFKELTRNETGKTTGVVANTPVGETRISASLVVGADGGQSQIRAGMNSRTRIHKYRDAFIVGLVGPAKDLGDRARQYIAPEHMLGLLPVADRATFIHHCIGPRSFDEYKQMGLENFRKEVISTAPELEASLGSVDSWNRFAYFSPSNVQVDQWVEDGVALLGDSAHVLHPHSGQGLNLSLQDAVSLATTVENCQNEKDYSTGRLLHYQEERKPVSDVVGHHAHYSTVYALSKNRLVQRLNRRAMKRLQRDRKLQKDALAITAGVFKEKPGLLKQARIGGILP